MKSVVAALAFAASVSAAAAQDGYYWGFGVGYSSMESAGFETDVDEERSTADALVFGLTAGYRFPQQSKVFYAVEGDADISSTDLENSGLSCSDGFANEPYYCTHAATLRLRGLAGVPMNNGWEVFGSAGLGVVFGESAIAEDGDSTSTTTGGLTFGVGVQGAMGGGTARVEVIRDNLTSNISGGGGYEPDFQATTVKATYLFSF